MAIRKAVRTTTRLLMGIAGYSGTGKTYTALKLARHLVGPTGKIVVIDTESAGAEVGASELYAPKFGHDVLLVRPPFRPGAFVTAIQEALDYGADAIIIDSLSDEWNGPGGSLQWVDELEAKSRNSGWRTVTPEHDKLMKAIETCPIHLICNLRSKHGVEIEKSADNKTVITKVPLKVIAREETEFLFTLYGTLQRTEKSDQTRVFIEKSRYDNIETGKYYDPSATELFDLITNAVHYGDEPRPTKTAFLKFLESNGIKGAAEIGELTKAIPLLGRWDADRHDEMVAMVQEYLTAKQEPVTE